MDGSQEGSGLAPRAENRATDRDALTVSEALLEALESMGARFAFGVIGGALVPFYDALRRSRLKRIHCRHESGAAYAALEASLSTDAPALVFVTTGPGLINALTGAVAARWEGAKVLLVSGCTGSERRGRFSLQESNSHTLTAAMYTPHQLFDYAVALDQAAELPRVLRALAMGFASRRGFVAHLALPLALQGLPAPTMPAMVPAVDLAPNNDAVSRVLHCLREPFAVWVGYGARHAAAQVRELVARTHAPVFATPRGKGIVPETDPCYLGVSGIFGGDKELAARLQASRVKRVLVLGSRLGELSSAYEDGLVPAGGLIHVDLDPHVPGAAFPHIDTIAVQAEIGEFLNAILAGIPDRTTPMLVEPRSALPRLSPRASGRVRPQYLMQCVQDRIVDGSKSVLMAESGNAFAWTTRHLRIPSPHRYRQSGLFCPMGQVSAGVIGSALGSGHRAVAIVGDGAFLMQNEVSTAVQIGADVTWIVLNDGRYGMVHQGLRGLGYAEPDMDFPVVDFLQYARSLGANGARAREEQELMEALHEAMEARGPFVLDVSVDPEQLAPFGDRLRSITMQANGA